jgi:hypothetical protein
MYRIVTTFRRGRGWRDEWRKLHPAPRRCPARPVAAFDVPAGHDRRAFYRYRVLVFRRAREMRAWAAHHGEPMPNAGAAVLWVTPDRRTIGTILFYAECRTMMECIAHESLHAAMGWVRLVQRRALKEMAAEDAAGVCGGEEVLAYKVGQIARHINRGMWEAGVLA